MPTQLHKNLVGADAVHQAAFVQATDPGSVGASLFWIDTSSVPPAMKIRNATNTGWTAFGVGSVGATGAAGTNGAPGPAGTAGTNIVSGAAPYICIQDQKTQNTAGGTFTSGAWRTRTLNTIVANDSFLASLASNQVTLPAGLWRCAITCPAFDVVGHQARLQSITNGVTVLLGTSEWNFATSNGAQTRSVITGRFAIQQSSVLEVQHQCGTTFATQGFGIAANFTTEVYTVVEFWLEGPPPPFMGSTFANPGLDRLGDKSAIARSQDFQQHSLNTPPQ